jgi:hypothetical protein
MNAQQRKFLIERIQIKTKARISELEKTKLNYPNVPNYLFKAILSGKLELQPDEHTMSILKERALKAKEGANWLSDQSNGWEKFTTIKLQVEDLIVIPEDYKKEREMVVEHNEKVDEEIKSLRMQLETVEMRVQLASDKTLQKLINEVDDMRELSLIDTKIKFLNS